MVRIDVPWPGGDNQHKTSKFANGPLRELWVLLRYKGVSRLKHPLFITTRVGLYVLLAGLLSSFFYSQDRQVTGILNIVGILFISVILPCFMAQVFVEEMKFDREVRRRAAFYLLFFITSTPRVLAARLDDVEKAVKKGWL